MPDISALDKHPCPACGAQAVWNPAKQMLVCPFCGTASPFKLDATTGAIEELDLAKAQSCKAVSVFDPQRVGQNCDFCGSPALVDYKEIKAPIRPQSLLPFTITDSNVREQIRKWYASKWLAPNALKNKALVDRLHGVYIPYWTFDAHVVSPWTAEAGHYYYTTETYREGGQTRTRQVRHTRWEPASGEVRHFFDDEPVPGTQGVAHHLLKQVEPFPTNELKPYDTSFLAGFVVEHYQIVLFDAAQRSQESMTAKVYQMSAAQIPGDTYRNLEIHPVFSGQTFKHILVPVWLLTYTFGAKVFQVIVNGVTGRMAGDYPKSWVKIALLVLLAIVVLVVVAMLSDN
jgi:hypothetical protein